jgi:8-oxo-dGTP diphosphatase
MSPDRTITVRAFCSRDIINNEMSKKPSLELPNCFYRVSTKALILNEERDKFLVCYEEAGFWELPGGGLEWGTTPQDDLAREIKEEMNIEVAKVASKPSYFLTGRQTLNPDVHIVNVVFECEVVDLNFTPTYECTEISFIDKSFIDKMEISDGVLKLSEVFNPENHPNKL